MAEMKTRPTRSSVAAFVGAIAEEARRRDCLEMLKMMTRATGAEPEMWGSGIVGFGRYRYRYDSRRQGEWFLTGFSPRKKELSIYIVAGFERYGAIMCRLGRYKTGRSCLYIRSLADVDPEALEELITESVKSVRESHPDVGVKT